MFPFDPTALPQITARRAFIGVDFQRAFAPGGTLPITEPDGYADRAANLAAAFRETNGDVIWVRSNFDKPQPFNEDQIVVSDNVTPSDPDPARRATATTRRQHTTGESRSSKPTETQTLPDEEAFLSHDSPSILASTGLDWSPTIADTMAKSDVALTKTSYSAFEGTSLLRLLRAKMVMEVFICGSLANIGVYATALDAAGHGLNITVVEDCCGYRTELRQRHAVQRLIRFTGCEIASAKETLDLIQPPSLTQRKTQPPSSLVPPVPADGTTGDVRTSHSPDIVRPMTGLKLASKSPSADPSKPSSAHGIHGSTGAAGERLVTSHDNVVDDATPVGMGTPTCEPATPPKSKWNQELISEAEQSTLLDSTPSIGEETRSIVAESACHTLPLVTVPDSGSSLAVPDVETTPSASTPANDSKHHDEIGDRMPQTGLCEGDSDVITGVLPEDLERGIFDKLRDEVKWQRMSHQGGDVPRLICVQTWVAEDGSVPIYRHPSDESPPSLPFSPTVLAIKASTEKLLGHPLNHVLIQLYRDGNDYISEHSDKTLDIVHGSYIANVSLGAQRTMVLRTKRLDKDPSRESSVALPTSSDKRSVHRATLPHNSLFRMGLETNKKWLHSIRQDKRAHHDKSAAELAFEGSRISLTFRQIGTFLSGDEAAIWGQGATAKTPNLAQPVINGQGPEAKAMVKAFGIENRDSNFDWNTHYGRGFDVLHMNTAARYCPSRDPIMNMQVSLMLAELGVTYVDGTMGPTKIGEAFDLEILPIQFVDNDAGKSTVYGHVAILLYLETAYGCAQESRHDQPRTVVAKQYTLFQRAIAFSERLRKRASNPVGVDQHSLAEREFPVWERSLAETGGKLLVSSEPSLPDFVLWPALHSLVEEYGLEILGKHSNLKTYYSVFGARESVRNMLQRLAKADPRPSRVDNAA